MSNSDRRAKGHDATRHNAGPSADDTQVPDLPGHPRDDEATGSFHGNGGLVFTPPPALASHPRYQLLGLLGTGGMGAVYKARHRLMERLVALKVIRPDLVNEPGLAVRFRREMWAAARLCHPNIVTSFDAEQLRGAHFLVMEYVEGVNLDEVLGQRGPLPVAEACDYARQAALGLHHAFERGMVHRDVKPHNLMLTPQGLVKILDFGLARFLSELPSTQAAQRETQPVSAATPSEMPLGTVDYQAPEEAEDARQADIRADIYSLGCTLYRFLCGNVPFPGGSAADKLYRHRFVAPPPLADVPPGLGRVVARMLEKDPPRRHQTPADAARDLAPFATTHSRHILVVDDELSVRTSLALSLQGAGFTVTTAADGFEALTRLREGLRPDLILLDLAMQGMDGVEFLRAIKADATLATLPVVIVSATDAARVVAALGATDFVQKPVESAELTDKVRRHTGADQPGHLGPPGAAG